MGRKKKRKEQCYVFEKKFFPSMKKVRSWLKKKDIKIKKIRKFEDCYRMRVRPYWRFKKKSIKNKKIDKKVQLIDGILK